MMFGCGKSMGGGGGGGGNLLRSVGRAVTRVNVAGGALQEPLSSSSSNGGTATTPTTTRKTHKPTSSNNLSLSSSSSSSSSSTPFASYNIPINPTSGLAICSSLSHSDDEFDWVSVDGVEDFGEQGVVVDDIALGSVPSQDEVQNVVSALQRILMNMRNTTPFVSMKRVINLAPYPQLVRDKFASKSGNDVGDQVVSPTGLGHQVSPVGSELDWREPPLHLCNSKMMQPHGYRNVYDAFHLLQTEPLIQRMVVSLSSDKSVWDAVQNNEVVRELRESFYADQESSSKNPDETPEDSNKVKNIIKWIFDSTRAKFMEVIEKITSILSDLFQHPEDVNTAGTTNLFNEKLKTSFMLSIMVLLIVVVGRAQKA
ncbi:hypothetical protein FEM48_Zijuj03G0136300 [Ziziphus jujuba var. spinosa]|uniref:Uncharacterized protein n=1 Tax=Ziziphus jujuba var. spinosa TaxID=714518 RepID=A0A978VQM0_ZIZJJ|nr:hypothetical protein FEM48_Zijuj03G0136300 [Ziziphus jujuba var. spinosa]